MLLFAVFIAALVVTMALIPSLIQFAGPLRLLDKPGERKVHTESIPRVGGIGMVLGVFLPVLIWVPLDREIISLLVGICILFVFGVWDDRNDLDYRLKLLGQVLAAIVVVGYGGVLIRVVPFFGMDPVSEWFAMPLTVIAIVAVTNSINLADGLDGLAAGTTMLSLAGTALLAYQADGTDILMTALCVMGVIAGFLRFNTYPARIFMGDTGSQFLGFTVVVLIIMLTQMTNQALNPALPLLLIGVPLFDTAFVILKRLYSGMSPFVADKNHVHHQLLTLKFDHYEAVVIIYIVQALFVASGIFLKYQSDLVIVSIWLVFNMTLAFALITAGRNKWHVHQPGDQSILTQIVLAGKSKYLYKVSLGIILAGSALLLFSGPLLASAVDSEFGIASALLLALLFTRLIFGYRFWFVSLRLLMYVTIAFVLYLLNEYPSEVLPPHGVVEFIYFGLVAIALVTGAQSKSEHEFQVTPMDFLLLLIMIGLAFIPQARAAEGDIIHLVIKIFIMFYAIEFALRNMSGRWNALTISALWALGVIAVRGVLSV